MTEFRKGQMVRYTSAHGHEYSALIERVHRTGHVTITVFFPIRDGRPMAGCFQGDKFKVPASRLSDLHEVA